MVLRSKKLPNGFQIVDEERPLKLKRKCFVTTFDKTGEIGTIASNGRGLARVLYRGHDMAKAERERRAFLAYMKTLSDDEGMSCVFEE